MWHQLSFADSKYRNKRHQTAKKSFWGRWNSWFLRFRAALLSHQLMIGYWQVNAIKCTCIALWVLSCNSLPCIKRTFPEAMIVFSRNHTSPQIEEIMNCCVHAQESLGLLYWFEVPHPPLSHSCRLMRKFCSIIGILWRVVNRIRNKFTVGNPITF